MFNATVFLRFAACCCVAAVVCNARAQELRNDGVSEPLDGLRERITSDLKKWDSIANHRTGSDGDNATAEWLADEIRAMGFKPQLDTFEFQRRVLKECSVVIGETRIVGVPLFDGDFTGVEPVRAKLGRPDVPGTIALTYYSTKKLDAETQTMMATRLSKNHLAMVSIGVQNANAPGIRMINADRYNDPYGLPTLLVSGQDGEALEKALKSGEEVEFRAQSELKISQATNVQVTIKGKRPELRPLVFMTPRSAWWTCTSERGGGVTVWLESIRHFAMSPPERDVIFVATTGHELGHLGLKHFLENHGSLLKEAHVWIHLGANLSARDCRLIVQTSNAEYEKLSRTHIPEQQRTKLTIKGAEERPLGEAAEIFDAKGQYVSILAQDNSLFHHPHDRWPHAVDLQGTVDLTRGLLQIVNRLAKK